MPRTIINQFKNIMTNFDLIAEAIEMINAGDNEAAIARLKQFTALNTTKVKGGKIKIYDWTDDKSIHTYAHGVYHDATDSVAVATETHVMLVSKSDYRADFAGKIIDKKGMAVNGRLHDYKRVIPNSAGMTEISINRDRIARLLSDMRAERKLDKSIDYAAFNIGCADTPLFFSPKFCKLLLTLPEGKFYFSNRTRPLLYKSNDGNYVAVAMPVCVKDEYIGLEKLLRSQCGLY